jgi:hypothetical protein
VKIFNFHSTVIPPAHAGSSLADFYTLKMEAILSFEMAVYTRSTRRHIPEDGIVYSHRRENLKSYRFIFCSYIQIVPEACFYLCVTDFSAVEFRNEI